MKPPLPHTTTVIVALAAALVVCCWRVARCTENPLRALQITQVDIGIVAQNFSGGKKKMAAAGFEPAPEDVLLRHACLPVPPSGQKSGRQKSNLHDVLIPNQEACQLAHTPEYQRSDSNA
jgi:hypothetical protein